MFVEASESIGVEFPTKSFVIFVVFGNLWFARLQFEEVLKKITISFVHMFGVSKAFVEEAGYIGRFAQSWRTN